MARTFDSDDIFFCCRCISKLTGGWQYLLITFADSYSGKVVIMLGIEYPSARISGVKILQQNETPGLGAKCTEPAFIDQFLGKDLSHDLTVSKNASQSQEIQAITASTITSKAVVKGINSARKHYQEHFGVSKAAEMFLIMFAGRIDAFDHCLDRKSVV